MIMFLLGCVCTFAFIFICALFTERGPRPSPPPADPDEDIDGKNFDDQDPGEWWKRKSGRRDNGKPE